MAHNPYAAPRSTLSHAAHNADDLWRIKKIAVLRRDAALPDRCIKCNAPAVSPYKKQTLFWHHPAYYLLILFNIIVYAVVALFVRKTAKLEVGLCEEHHKRLRWGKIVGWGGFVLVMAGIIVSAVEQSSSLAVFTGFLGVVWIIATITITRLLIATRISKEYVQIKGCGPLFLDSLPEFPGKPT